MNTKLIAAAEEFETMGFCMRQFAEFIDNSDAQEREALACTLLDVNEDKNRCISDFEEVAMKSLVARIADLHENNHEARHAGYLFVQYLKDLQDADVAIRESRLKSLGDIFQLLRNRSDEVSFESAILDFMKTRVSQFDRSRASEEVTNVA